MNNLGPDSAGELVGNTRPIPPPLKNSKQPNKAKQWCFTLNNFTADEIVLLKQKFEELCHLWIFEEESGESGTPHLQGYINLKDKMRPTEFKLSSRIHWEVKGKKSTELENIFYCSKDFRNHGNKVYHSLNVTIPRPLKLITPDRGYQKYILNLISQPPDDRTINWFWEDVGGVGKSSFCKYLIHKNDACYLTEGKKSDIMNMVYNYVLEKYLDLVVVDIPRSNTNISYKSLEEIKNGIISNTKYETGTKIINSPHIIVFANWAPDVSKMSADRWNIHKIDSNYELV